MSKTNIEFINHASVLISCGKISLLSDPWYNGPVFHHGMKNGVRYNHPITKNDNSTLTLRELKSSRL